MMDYSIYNNPLITRYASKEMHRAFSDEKRFKLWRKLWIALAESEMELGLNITQAQVDELKAHAEDIDYELAAQFEREVRHDVMAHVKAYGESAKTAKPIIHLGATSCFVNCNAEAIMLNDALDILLKKLVNVMDKLKKFALAYKDVPTLGFTHLQPAQLTTVGKRATLWLQDLEMDYENLIHAKEGIFFHAALHAYMIIVGTQRVGQLCHDEIGNFHLFRAGGFLDSPGEPLVVGHGIVQGGLCQSHHHSTAIVGKFDAAGLQILLAGGEDGHLLGRGQIRGLHPGLVSGGNIGNQDGHIADDLAVTA